MLLSRVRNHLLLQFIQVLMCLGSWSLRGLVKDKDILAVTSEVKVEGEEEYLLEGWDSIGQNQS